MACIYCASEDSKREIDLIDVFGDQHHFDSCQNCGIYFLNPQPTKQQLSIAYDESYYGVGDKKFNPTVERVLDWFRRRSAQRLSKGITPTGKILDIGCGNGNFLTYLGETGRYELHGIEPEGKSAERSKQNTNIHLHQGYFIDGLYPNSYFDLITLIHVFEHLANPKQGLDIISKIAKINATLVIEIPNVSSWQSIVFGSNWFHLDPPRHLNMFPPEILKEEVIKLGWEIQEEHYFSIQFSPFGAQQSILNSVLKKRDVLYEHLKGNLTYAHEYSRINIMLQKMFHWLSFPIFILTDLIASIFKKGATVRLVFKKK